jgi:hypothetical protein
MALKRRGYVAFASLDFARETTAMAAAFPHVLIKYQPFFYTFGRRGKGRR